MEVDFVAELAEFRHSFGHYLLEGESKLSLGESYVTIGTHTDLYRGIVEDKIVAVRVWRVVSLPATDRKNFENRLLEELPEWNRCQHPNIVPFLGVAPVLGRIPSVVMPYFNNGTVNDYILHNPMANRIQFVRDIASALIYMHSLTPAIVHGDIKGANILINDAGLACVSDIGVSKVPFPVKWSRPPNTRPARWMAPELVIPPIENSEKDYPVTCQTDVYSFSMTVIEILTGRLPFSHRRHDTTVIEDIFYGRRPLRPSIPEMTDSLWELIQSCWHQDPSKRSTMAIVGFWLELLEEPEALESETARVPLVPGSISVDIVY